MGIFDGFFQNTDGQNIPGYPLPVQSTVKGSNGATYLVSAFGVDDTTFGASFRPQTLLESDRYKLLDFRSKFYACRQHDHKIYDMSGRMTRGGMLAMQQPLLSSQPPPFYVSLDQRRPNNPYRLARLITQTFTNFIFGEGRFPKLRCVGDQDAEEFAEALVEASELKTAMIRARNSGGSSGSVALSWRFYQGKPCVRVHASKNVFVHEWVDQDEGIVHHASEITLVYRNVWDPKTKQNVRAPHWHRRDWTPNADIVFVDQPLNKEGAANEWIVDEDQTVIHDDGFAHCVWIPNQPSDDGEDGCDGEPDYEGLYEQTNTIDLLNSVLATGTTRNLDPTLVLKLSTEQQAMMQRGVSKGSDHALNVGETGDAKYLELGGTAAQAGIVLLDQQRKFALEVAQCVIPNPDQIAAAATSGLAIKLLYAPMASKASIYRAQYGRGIVQLITQMISSARRRLPTTNEDGSLEYAVEINGETGEQVPVEYVLDLPPRVVSEEEIDPLTGLPTGKQKIVRYEQRSPGQGRTFTLEWPKQFESTDTDDQAAATTLSSSTGGKPFVSQRSAVEVFAKRQGRDPVDEWKRITEEKRQAEERELGMFPGTGGRVESTTSTEPSETSPVEANEQEEAIVREQEGGGDNAVPALEQEVQISPSFVLNGAQIQAALDIVKQVATNQLPRDAAIGLLMVGFNMSEPQATQVLGSAGLGFVPASSDEAIE